MVQGLVDLLKVLKLLQKPSVQSLFMSQRTYQVLRDLNLNQKQIFLEMLTYHLTECNMNFRV